MFDWICCRRLFSLSRRLPTHAELNFIIILIFFNAFLCRVTSHVTECIAKRGILDGQTLMCHVISNLYWSLASCQKERSGVAFVRWSNGT